MEISYRKAVKRDAELLIMIYNAAFYDDYIKYGECPGYGRTKERMEFSIENFPKYIIICDGNPVGVISYQSKGNGEYYLGCLCIIPDYQRKGIGSKAFRYFLSNCEDWIKITLITPSDNESNIRFYEDKCGFIAGEKSKDGNVEVINFYKLRKNTD